MHLNGLSSRIDKIVSGVDAQWEMYVGPSVVGGFEAPQKVCASTLLVNGVKPVRYLRSDLTCGECVNPGNIYKCPHSIGYHATWPACMKFEPKE